MQRQVSINSNTAHSIRFAVIIGRFEEVKQTAEVAVEAALPSSGAGEGAKEALRKARTLFWVLIAVDEKPKDKG